MSFRPVCLFLAAALLALPAARAQTPNPSIRLNDTGQTMCYDGTTTMVTCTADNTGDGANWPGQDGRFGRDAQKRAGTLNKIGDGDAGFDFTAFDELDSNDDPVPVQPGTHLCVKDNVTGLVWSTETLSGNWDYAMNTAPGAYNIAARCGFSDWRLPTRRELLSIVHYGKSGSGNSLVDQVYFPDTLSGLLSGLYWSNSPVVGNLDRAWSVDFRRGHVNSDSSLINNRSVRLVRSGQ